MGQQEGATKTDGGTVVKEGATRREGSGHASCSSEALPWLKSMARQGLRCDVGKSRENSARRVFEQRVTAYLRHFHASRLQLEGTQELDDFARKHRPKWVRPPCPRHPQEL